MLSFGGECRRRFSFISESIEEVYLAIFRIEKELTESIDPRSKKGEELLTAHPLPSFNTQCNAVGDLTHTGGELRRRQGFLDKAKAPLEVLPGI